MVHRSSLRGSDALNVSILELPNQLGPTTFRRADAYYFAYRPRFEKGETHVAVPGLGLVRQRISRERVIMFSPNVSVRAEWENAGGRVACFLFSARFLEGIAQSHGISFSRIRRMETPPFSINDRIESVCRLLMDEAEDRRGGSLVYCEALATALAASVLGAMNEGCSAQPPPIPPSIRRVVERLNADFESEHSIAALAELAQLRRSSFVSLFRRATGESPHKYLLRIRVDRARKLMDEQNGRMSLAEIATACGFFDQSHLNRLFRQFYGTTPAAFQRSKL